MERPLDDSQRLAQDEQVGIVDQKPERKGFPVGRNTLLKEGVTFTITGSDGTALYLANAACNTSAMLFSSAEDNQTVQTGTVSMGMDGMRDHGGQRPDGEKPDGSAPAEVFVGKTPDRKAPDGNEPPEKSDDALVKEAGNSEKT